MVLVKVVVFVLMTWFIVQQLFLKNDFTAQLKFFSQNFNPDNAYLFIIAVLLMPVNWLLETVKWQMLLKVDLPFLNLLKSVIAGITFGFVTPARSGEFVGRAMYLDDESKPKIFFLSVVGGIVHTAITVGAGAICVALWSDNAIWASAATGASIGFFLLYFRYDLFNRIIASVPFLEQRNLFLHKHQLPDFPTQVKVLLITALRYAVYLTQYVALMMFFGVGNNFFALFIHNGVFFLVHTFSPLMPFLDFTFRGGAALYIFGSFTSNNIAVISAVLWAWVMNLVIPAVIGYLFILNRRIVPRVIQ